MWLKNTENGRYYPYTDFLEQHYNMIRVYNNPFEETPVVEDTPEEAEEIRYNIEEEVIEEEKNTEVLKPRLVKPKGKTKK